MSVIEMAYQKVVRYIKKNNKNGKVGVTLFLMEFLEFSDWLTIS